MKITSQAGPVFFIRKRYLSLVKPEAFVENAVFEGEEEEDIVEAGMTYAAEAKAIDYLERCEQSRSGLYKKLLSKSFAKNQIERALDYLEERNFLSDARFSRAWLNSRRINHCEGRVKLSAELYSRGISKEIVNSALDEFFTENSEEDLCRKDFEKARRIIADQEKIIRRLMAHGFSYSLIKNIISESD